MKNKVPTRGMRVRTRGVHSFLLIWPLVNAIAIDCIPIH